MLTGSSLSDNDIIQAERSLYRVRHDLVAKREEISRQNVSQEATGSGGWMGRVFGSKADQGAYCGPTVSLVRADVDLKRRPRCRRSLQVFRRLSVKSPVPSQP